MKKLALAFLAAALLAPASARAQFVNLRIPLPPIPPLVVVSPGIQVVENHDDEVFFHEGFYWARRDGRWYRAQNHQHEFVYVEERHVPRPLFGTPPGHYRHYRHERRHERHEDRHDVREERREDRHDRHEERREDKHDRREERREDRHDGHQVRAAPGTGQPVHQAQPAPKKKDKGEHGHH
jgi:hypothetical protein